MKIHTLGTSHGNATHSRFHSSTVYETGDGSLYLVDVGAPASALILRAGLSCNDLRAAFVTHMHDDHAGGLTDVLVQVNKYAERRRFPFHVHLPEEGAIDALKTWFSALHEDASSKNILYTPVAQGPLYEDENLTVTAITTRHLKGCDGTPCSFAYDLYFKKEGKRVLHTGDLTHDFSDFPAVAGEEPFDACLCEATHYKPEGAAPYLEKARLLRLIFVHIGDRWHGADSSTGIPGEGEQALLALAATYPYPVCIAHDGDVFEI